jgi:hypothetical protein
VGHGGKCPHSWHGEGAVRRAGKPLDVKTVDALKPRAATYRVSDGGEPLRVCRRPVGLSQATIASSFSCS